MKSFRVYLPKSQTAKTATWVVGAWVAVALLVLAWAMARPQPTLHLRKEIGEARAFIIDAQRKNGGLPSQAESESWMTKRGLRVEYALAGEAFSLTGWDGEHRWRYASEDKAFTKLE